MTNLGRRVPTDWVHVERYPLQALVAEARPTNVPVPIGVNWYAEFDRPVQGSDGRWRVAANNKLTRVRGGHCVCLAPARVRDRTAWWSWYDQGNEGACVGYGLSRAMSLLNRRRYDAGWLYHTAQWRDEWSDTPPEEGTSVRAGLDVLRTVGHKRVRGVRVWESELAEGIAANRWATSIQDVLDTLGRPNAIEVPWLNSWGKSYPHLVYVPVDVLERLRQEDGEFGVITDR